MNYKHILPGIGFIINGKSTRGIIYDIIEENVLYFYEKNGKIYGDTIKADILETTGNLCTQIYERSGLYAKVIDYKLSSSHYGMRMRKEALLFTIMEVRGLSLERNENLAITLLSTVGDISVKMDYSEIKFIFPENKIIKSEKQKTKNRSSRK